MKDFFPIKLTGLLYITVGMILLIPALDIFLNNASFKISDLMSVVWSLLLPLIPVFVGIGVFKKEKGVAILALIFLPFFWIALTLGFAVAGVGGTAQPLFFPSLIIPPILFILTIWSLFSFKKKVIQETRY